MRGSVRGAPSDRRSYRVGNQSEDYSEISNSKISPSYFLHGLF